jgi:TPR repeat protein
MVQLGGLLLANASNAGNQSQAASLFRRAAQRGSIDAQYNWGVCLRRGLGVARDDVKAELAYQAAAAQGHRSAQLALGSLKAQSARTDSDWQDVAHWYRLAADGGHPAAMASLAELYEIGRGVMPDRGIALTLHRKASAAGHAESAPAMKRLESELRLSDPVA